MIGLKESTNPGNYRKTIHRSLGGGAFTSVNAYDSSTIQTSANTLAAYGDEVRRDELFSTAVIVMEKDSQGFIGLGYRLRSAGQAANYIKSKAKQRAKRNQKKFRKLGRRDDKEVQSMPESNEMRKERRRLRRAEKKAQRAGGHVEDSRQLSASDKSRDSKIDEITGPAVLRYGFGCQEFHKLTVGVSSLSETETAVYKVFREGSLVSEGIVTGTSSGAVEFVVEPGQLFDTLEFSAGPSSSFLMSHIEYCKPSTCTGARAGFYGDPHLNTFDKLRWSCMGWGHFMMFEGVKGNGKPNTEIQVIFDKMEWVTRKATSTRAVVIDAGEPDTPVLQFSAIRMPKEDETCAFTFLVNGEEQDLDLWVDSNDKAIVSAKGMSLECGNKDRMRSRGSKITVNYPEIGLEVQFGRPNPLKMGVL